MAIGTCARATSEQVTIEAEADVVRQAYAWYTRDGLSIGGVTRRLNELSVPTKKQGVQWERSTVWAMLRNPAYKGTACFGKTQAAARQRTNTRSLRQRGSLPARASANHELPREQWIEIPVPALIEADTFDAAQERLASNKQRSSRRTLNRAFSKVWSIAKSVATPCIGPPRTAARARSTTTVAWAPMRGAIQARPAVMSARSARIYLIISCGQNLCA
jgi:Recombinase